MLQLFLPMRKKSLFTTFEFCVCARGTRAPQLVIVIIVVQPSRLHGRAVVEKSGAWFDEARFQEPPPRLALSELCESNGSFDFGGGGRRFRSG